MILHLDRSNSYTVPGTVQGKTANFLLDTGATSTFVSSQVAAAAGLPVCKRMQEIRTANGSVRACSTVASEITFGTFRMENVSVVIMPMMSYDVLLGMNVLRQLKLEHRADQLIISR